MSFRPRAARTLPAALLSAALLLSSSASPDNFARQQSAPARQTPPSQATPEATPPSSAPVTLHVTVLGGRDRARMRLVTGLGRENFSVVERKQAREITHFAAADEPASVAILVDTSGSFSHTYMKERLEVIQQGIARLVYRGHPASEYFIATFNARSQTSSEWTRDPASLARAVGLAPLGGHTPFLDACYAALEKLARGPHPKRALVLLSDGQDNLSRRKPGEVRRLFRLHGVQLYAVGPGLASEDNSYGYGARVMLREWAESTGGQAFFPRYGHEVLSAFEWVAETLRHQYAVGFEPSAPEAGEQWHEVKVSVSLSQLAPELARELKHVRVHAREGYFTPPAAP
jgi:Ca-activated chloride channel homolog